MTEEPSTYQAALRSSNSKAWQRAMEEEYDSLIKNGTWIVQDLPPGSHTVKNK